MLRSLTALLALATLTAAAQAEPAVLEQYRSANTAFLGTPARYEDYFDAYRKAVVTGLEGRWLRLDASARPRTFW